MTRITIMPVARGRYRASVGNYVLVNSSREPEFDAARRLVALGVKGNAETWRPGATAPAMRFDIELAAGVTVEESERRGPRFRRWLSRPIVGHPSEGPNFVAGDRTGGDLRVGPYLHPPTTKNGRPRAQQCCRLSCEGYT